MRILAIESSCDETAAAVVENGRKIISNVVNSQIAEHAKYGGVVPEIASRRHIENIVGVVDTALCRADMTMKDVDAIAVTYAPGLIGALLVGVNFAKGAAMASGKPIIPVHHLRGHIAANYLVEEHSDLEPPFLALVVSGGHTHIIKVKNYTDFEVIGRTRDDAAGEAFDKAARAMGFPYPGGANLEKAAMEGKKGKYRLPRPQVNGSELDFSFSGLKTAVVNIIHRANQVGGKIDIPALAAEFEDAATEMIESRIRIAIEITGEKRVVAAGGVAANGILRKRLENVCRETGRRLYIPPVSLCGDNAAMIGAQGFYEFEAGVRADMSLNAYATMDIGNIYL
ncbi:MAG: tRNA (adenosine(37)-N6)-threonylcarbamoyltransferase complex transferase subunit TsaD [Oscillospiraceae bacterium]|nr:tRNA (adenosine(37)-N6)-threonylcarbamoyltransferase complex transferase subunit TsaD [Oscillospiraceae bacterium]